MGKWVNVAGVNDLQPGDAKTVSADGTDIALFNVGGTFHAVNNTCLHRGGPLGEGMLEGEIVTCPWHGWQYNVTTGKTVANPGMGVEKYNTRVEGSDVFVELP